MKDHCSYMIKHKHLMSTVSWSHLTCIDKTPLNETSKPLKNLNVLAGTDLYFPLNLWDWLVSQITTTPNSATAIKNQSKTFIQRKIERPVWIQHNTTSYNWEKFMIHEKLGQRTSWKDDGAKWWYIRPAPKHYIWWALYVKKGNGMHWKNGWFSLPQSKHATTIILRNSHKVSNRTHWYTETSTPKSPF